MLALGAETIGVTTSFYELGGHSLKAIALVSEIYKTLAVEVRVSDVFRHPTVRAMARRIGELTGADTFGTIDAAPVAPAFLASSVQARMFLLQQMEPASTAYNVAGLFEVTAGITREHVARALDALVQRHDAFRCAFYLDGTVARLRVVPDAVLTLTSLETTEAARDAAVDGLVQPFELAAAPLARATWVTTERGQYLFFDMHHIVTDGVSMGILFEELEALLTGAPLAAIATGLVDCTAWEQGERAQALFAKKRL